MVSRNLGFEKGLLLNNNLRSCDGNAIASATFSKVFTSNTLSVTDQN